jgi:hypothetical protein
MRLRRTMLGDSLDTPKRCLRSEFLAILLIVYWPPPPLNVFEFTSWNISVARPLRANGDRHWACFEWGKGMRHWIRRSTTPHVARSLTSPPQPNSTLLTLVRTARKSILARVLCPKALSHYDNGEASEMRRTAIPSPPVLVRVLLLPLYVTTC